MKKYLCRFCGETNPMNFYGNKKSKCKRCESAENKKKYIRHKKIPIKGIERKKNTTISKLKEKGKKIKRLIVSANKKRTAKPNTTKPHTTESFILVVIQNHGNKYSFEKTVFKGTTEYVTVTCVKHNCDITVIAETLLRRTAKNGGKKKDPVVGSCPKCREEYFIGIKKRMIDKFREVHNNRYDYDESSYVNYDTPFTAICRTHGPFKVTPGSHINVNGNGHCPECLNEKSNKDKEKIIDGNRYYACDIHGNVPIGNHRKLIEGCPSCKIDKANQIIVESSKNTIRKRLEGKFYIEFHDDDTVTLKCKKHGEIKTVSRKKLVDNHDRHYCSGCRQDAVDESLKASREVSAKAKINVVPKLKKILSEDYKDTFEFLEFIDNGKGVKECLVRLMNLVTNKEKIVTTQAILNKVLTKDREYLERNFLSYDDAKKKVQRLKITSFREYQKWRKRCKQPDLPANIMRTYGKDFISYHDFFGTTPQMRMSLGELRIDNYLRRKNIKCTYQKKFKDCRDKMPLPFDFYLDDYNVIIEFDGEHHRKAVDKWGGEEHLKTTQLHDKIKDQYCKDNGIILMRIHSDDLLNNVLEWAIELELTRIKAELAIQELDFLKS